jgi:hypothetical protein
MWRASGRKPAGSNGNRQEKITKALALAVSTTVIAGTVNMAAGKANSQSAGPYYSDTIHQSAGDRDARGTPKYDQRRTSRRHVPSTTGAGRDFKGAPPDPYYSNTIHQSAGDRDSRGTPKYYGR